MKSKKLERKTYGAPMSEAIPLEPLACYCGISGGDYHGSGNGEGGYEEYDEDSD